MVTSKYLRLSSCGTAAIPGTGSLFRRSVSFMMRLGSAMVDVEAGGGWVVFGENNALEGQISSGYSGSWLPSKRDEKDHKQGKFRHANSV
jgi:hypothetical protein